jgi:hypothetical protein
VRRPFASKLNGSQQTRLTGGNVRERDGKENGEQIESMRERRKESKHRRLRGKSNRSTKRDEHTTPPSHTLDLHPHLLYTRNQQPPSSG